MKLRAHDITLQGERLERLTLRPMTERDWPALLRWNSDPEVLYFAEGDDVLSRSLEDIQSIYRGVSQNAFCFIAEHAGMPIGECWLQRMNLERILRNFSGLDCRRIDLMIGQKALWGQGLGTEMIRTLTRFAFEQEKADLVFGCDIADYNPRSLKAFLKMGYEVYDEVIQPPGGKARVCTDVVLHRAQWQAGDALTTRRAGLDL